MKNTEKTPENNSIIILIITTVVLFAIAITFTVLALINPEIRPTAAVIFFVLAIVALILIIYNKPEKRNKPEKTKKTKKVKKAKKTSAENVEDNNESNPGEPNPSEPNSDVPNPGEPGNDVTNSDVPNPGEPGNDEEDFEDEDFEDDGNAELVLTEERAREIACEEVGAALANDALAREQAETAARVAAAAAEKRSANATRILELLQTLETQWIAICELRRGKRTIERLAPGAEAKYLNANQAYETAFAEAASYKLTIREKQTAWLEAEEASTLAVLDPSREGERDALAEVAATAKAAYDAVVAEYDPVAKRLSKLKEALDKADKYAHDATLAYSVPARIAAKNAEITAKQAEINVTVAKLYELGATEAEVEDIINPRAK